MSSRFQLADDHPLSRELASLRESLAKYQHEVHNLNIKLQRQSIDHSSTYKKLQQLSTENALLRSEITTLRSHPDVTPHQHALQAQELTQALRRISDKLDLTEACLLERTKEVVTERSEKEKLKSEAELTYAVATSLRSELDRLRAGQRQLEHRIKASEEERRMTDLAVEEYANLVRSLEGRSSIQHVVGGNERQNGYSSRMAQLDGLAVAKQGLQRLLEEFNVETENLHAEIARLHASLESVEVHFRAESVAAQEEREKLARALVEIERMRTDDNAAAKMVSRYMMFSQSSTNLLHTAIANLKLRHAAAIENADTRLRALEDEVAANKDSNDLLHQAVNDLTEELSRESYGRRREVTLRLGFLGREEAVVERLRRWLLRAHECSNKAGSHEDILAAYASLIADADSLLAGIDGIPFRSEESFASLGRILAAQSATAMLQEELHKETSRRLLLEQQVAALDAHSNSHESRISTPRGKHSPISNAYAWPSSPSFRITGKTPPARESITLIAANEPPHDRALTDASSLMAPEPQRDMPRALVIGENKEQATFAFVGRPDGGMQMSSVPVIDVVPSREADGSNSINLPVPNLGTTAFSPTSLPSDGEFSDANGSAKVVLQLEATGQVESQLGKHDQHTSDLSPLSDASPIASATSSALVSAHSADLLPPRQTETNIHFGSLGPSAQEPAGPTPLSTILSHDEVGNGLVYMNDAKSETVPSAVSSSDSKTRPSGDWDPSGGVPSELSTSSSSDALEDHEHLTIANSDSIVDIGTLGHGYLQDLECGRTALDGSINVDGQELADTESINPVTAPIEPIDNLLANKIVNTSDNLTANTTIVEARRSVVANETPFDDPLVKARALVSRLPQVGRRYESLQRSFRDCNLALGDLKEKTSPALRPVVDRLDDYCEDARVELEIVIADDERVAKGYETLLIVPGALADFEDLDQLTKEVEAFVEGTGEAAQSTPQKLKCKLDNLEHDIAILKRKVHETSLSDDFVEDEDKKAAPLSWASWTGSLLPSSRPSSPAPTFGSVITSPHRRQFSNSSRMSLDVQTSREEGYPGLGLRIPMPRARTTSYLEVGRRTPVTGPRLRTTSSLFNLGIGGGRTFSGSLVVHNEREAGGGSVGHSIGEDDVE